MLGPVKPCRLDEPIAVSLDDLVPQDNFYRHLEAKLDLSFVGDWTRELYVDATKVAANASLDSLVPRFAYEVKAHVADLFADERAVVEATPAPADDPPVDIVQLPIDSERARPEGDPPWRLLDPHRPAIGTYQRLTAFRVSPTDPDATPMWTSSGTALGYHDHYVVDGGKRRIILAALVTPADVMENVPLQDLLWRVCFRRKVWPEQVTGDTTYGTAENIVALEDAGIRAFFPLPDFEARTPFFGKGKFRYDAVQDAYRCPQGQLLPRWKAKHTEDKVVYRPDAGICNACLVKPQCTASKHGRMIHRSVSEAYLDWVHGYHATEAYQKAMRKRQVWVEPLFAEAKEWHGLRQLRLRGLLNANIQGLLIAAGQNLKRFLAARGWGRRHAPCGSLVALPRQPQSLSAVSE